MELEEDKIGDRDVSDCPGSKRYLKSKSERKRFSRTPPSFDGAWGVGDVHLGKDNHLDSVRFGGQCRLRAADQVDLASLHDELKKAPKYLGRSVWR